MRDQVTYIHSNLSHWGLKLTISLSFCFDGGWEAVEKRRRSATYLVENSGNLYN